MVIALINTDKILLETIREMLINEGHDVVIGHLSGFIEGTDSITEFVKEHEPDAVIFDIPPPYKKHWEYFRLVKQAFPDIGFVVTTTNVKDFDISILEVPIIQLVSKPFSVDTLLDALSRTEQVLHMKKA